jgi:hypothetical protein
MKLDEEELKEYWATLLDRRMPEHDDVERLINILKGRYLTERLHDGIPPTGRVADLIEFHGSKRPYGNKDVAASIVFNLGWDYKRQLCHGDMPEAIREAALRLHEAVLAYLRRC